MTKKRWQGANEGIQANVVKADVLAVGRGAQAIKSVLSDSDRKDLVGAVAQLTQQVKSLNLDKVQVEELSKHAHEIERAVAKPRVDPKEVQSAMGKFLDHLKQVGVALKEVAGFVAPIETMAKLLHISLSSLGLV
jgi:hypothetical protein